MNTSPQTCRRVVVGIVLVAGAWLADASAENFTTNTINGTVVNTNGTYFVGATGVSNALVIINGGSLNNPTAYIGNEPGADFNTALVSGSGSAWMNASDLWIGYQGAGNQLTINDGGSLQNDYAFIGGYAGSDFNTALVTGSGSSWTNTGGLEVGYYGAGNQLTIRDGGAVYSLGGYVGDQTDSESNSVPDNNSVLVTGSGSVWDLNFGGGGTLYFGYYGSGNTLTITNGGHVADYIAYVGFDAGSSNNVVRVTGSGSLWSLTNLYLGFFGGHNCLSITDGAWVNSTYVDVGSFDTGPSNAVSVAGSGSVWNCTYLYVGSDGSDSWGNSLVISNGAAVHAAYLEIGASAGGVNSITLEGGALTAGEFRIYSGAHVLSQVPYAVTNFLIRIDGGLMEVNATLGIAGVTGSTGSVQVIGGQLIVSNNVIGIGNNGTTSSSGGVGSLTITDADVIAGAVLVGSTGAGQGTLSILTNGTLIVSGNLRVGDCASNLTGMATLAGGTLSVTNAAHTAVLNVSKGSFTMTGGSLTVDTLILSNACGGTFTRTGGTLAYRQVILDPAGDYDGDGLPNGWEQTYGLDPLSSSGINGAGGDPDGDGLTNLQEFQAGTIPTLKLTGIAREGNNIRVSWNMGGSLASALQVCPVLASGSFTDLFTVAAGLAPSTNYVDVGALTNAPVRFYRVRLVP